MSAELKCEKCGGSLNSDDNFCGACGEKRSVENKAVVVTSETVSATPAKPGNNQSESKSSNTKLWIILGCSGLIFLALVLGVIIFFIILLATPKA